MTPRLLMGLNLGHLQPFAHTTCEHEAVRYDLVEQKASSSLNRLP